MPRQPPFHVWVDLTNSWTSPGYGLLIDWRRRDRAPGGWEAWVIWAASYSTGNGSEVTVTQSWVPGHLLRPADAPSPKRA